MKGISRLEVGEEAEGIQCVRHLLAHSWPGFNSKYPISSPKQIVSPEHWWLCSPQNKKNVGGERSSSISAMLFPASLWHVFWFTILKAQLHLHLLSLGLIPCFQVESQSTHSLFLSLSLACHLHVPPSFLVPSSILWSLIFRTPFNWGQVNREVHVCINQQTTRANTDFISHSSFVRNTVGGVSLEAKIGIDSFKF